MQYTLDNLIGTSGGDDEFLPWCVHKLSFIMDTHTHRACTKVELGGWV